MNYLRRGAGRIRLGWADGRDLDGEGGNGEGEVESWQGPGVGEEGEAVRVDKKEWGGEGGNEEETGRGGWRGGNLKGEMGGGGKGDWEKKGRGGGILQMDMMECLGGHML